MKLAKLPTRVVLPFGYVVTVKQVPADVWPHPDSDSVWDSDQRLILINKGLTAPRKRYLLTHEMLHVWADWQHHCLDRGIGGN